MKCWLIKFKLTEIELIHFHPSGLTQPSQQDKLFTQKLKQACDCLGIQLLDHIITGQDSYLSFREEGLLER
ncbi:JAB domain-containing protein [Lactococcus formosensis]|uniref:JAB domain-containing protein n=1 Tax=Lactococcus formosensis TaxID=1281486 RepID=UPI00254DD5A1|nr:JAB domain-containing protein [Lactococcus formosensis]